MRKAEIDRGPGKAEGAIELPERIRRLRDALLTGLVERDVSIRLALLAALAGEHLLLIGPPGTAKSLLARRLRLAFKDTRYFERLLTRFTVPEELFGPLSIKGLEQDRYERLTESYLPTASVAFLDEIFKANSAILNALLTLLNEREFDNGARRVKTPLISVVGASNELPEGEELAALYDRFLLRHHVGPVSKNGFESLLALGGDSDPEVPDALRLGAHELEAIRAEAAKVELPRDMGVLLAELRAWCAEQAVPVSDRRWRKIVKLLRVAAWTNGRTAVSVWDAWLLQHCLWMTPDQREAIYKWYEDRVGSRAVVNPERLTKILVFWEARLKKHQDAKSQAQDDEGRLLFVGSDGKRTAIEKGIVHKRRDGEPLYLAPQGAYSQYQRLSRDNNGRGYTKAELDELYLGQGVSFAEWNGAQKHLQNRNAWLTGEAELPPVMEAQRYSATQIADWLRQVSEVQANVEQYQQELQSQIESLRREIHGHLWVTQDFADPAARVLGDTSRVVGGLLQRATELAVGFSKLPRSDELSAGAVAPNPPPRKEDHPVEGDHHGALDRTVAPNPPPGEEDRLEAELAELKRKMGKGVGGNR